MKTSANRGPNIGGQEDQNVQVIEQSPISSTDVNTERRTGSGAKLTNRQVKLYWTKRFDENETTNTFLKEGEVFKKTKSVRLIPNPNGGEPIPHPIYSVVRGRRVYYVTEVTAEEKLLAQKFEDDKNKEREAKKAEKLAEMKAEREARKAEKELKKMEQPAAIAMDENPAIAA